MQQRTDIRPPYKRVPAFLPGYFHWAGEDWLSRVSYCVAFVCLVATLNNVIVVCEGIPDTLRMFQRGMASLAVVGSLPPKFWRCERVYVALDRDAVDKSIALAREFGRRGRVIVLPEELGPKGDLNDWLRIIARGDPEAFERLVVDAVGDSLTPWALAIERLPTVPRRRLWEIEDQIKHLLADLGPLSPIFRDSHLLLLADKTGLPLATLVAACFESDLPLEDGATVATPAAPLL